MYELELKFRGTDEALLTLRAALRLHGARALRMRACYYDTPDGRLAAAGVALRLRQEGQRWTQTLKGPGGSAVHRLEHELRLSPQAPRALDAARHDGTEAGRLLHQARGDAPDGALAPRLDTDVMRTRRVIDIDGTTVEVALDLGQVTAGGRSDRIAELELELLSGPLAPLFALARLWMAHGGFWLNTLSKAERGDRLLHAEATAPATRAWPIALPDAPTGADLMRAVLTATLGQVLAYAGDVADGSSQVEHVHQLRVGLRRLRTALRELAPLMLTPPDVQAPLAAAFATLGAQRDDVAALDTVRPILEAAGAPPVNWPAQPAPDLIAAVRAPAFQAALLNLLELAHAGDDAFAPLSASDARRFAARRLTRLHRRITYKDRRFDRLPVNQQHQMRKQLKRLRYLTEFVRPMWSHKAVQRYLDRLKPAQDALGLHNDVALAAERFRQRVETDAHAAFAAGYLQAHLAVTALAAHKALQNIDDDLRFWAD